MGDPIARLQRYHIPSALASSPRLLEALPLEGRCSTMIWGVEMRAFPFTI